MSIKSVKHFLLQWDFILRCQKYWKKPKSPSLDHLVYLFSLENRQISFVQIGAHSGQVTDPLYQYIRLSEWKGILVEPQVDLFKKLHRKFDQNSNITLENVAISDKNGEKPFYFLKSKSKSKSLPKWTDQLSSFHKEVPFGVLNQLPYARIDTISIKCMTLKSLFEKHNVQQLDLLMVDTEGHDYIVLQSLDFKKYCPKMILFEHCFLSEEDERKCLDLLRSQGYFLYRDGFNTIAFYSESISRVYANHI